MKLQKTSILMVIALWGLAAVHAQVQFVPGDYFPADLEFRELQPDGPAAVIIDAAALSEIAGGRLFPEIGFERYARREYTVDSSGHLSIEVVTLKDNKAAYSILTLLRGSEILVGPPGSAYSIMAGELMFAHENHWVRMRGRNIRQDLLLRVAASVNNRMGPPADTAPSLIRHFPELGLDGSSVRYFLGSQSFEEQSLSRSGALTMKFLADMEIAQAHYALENQSGILSLINFPTSQMAEDYYENIASLQRGALSAGGRIYVKKTGPLLAVLEGSFNPADADRILAAIQFTYSIKWIYDKNSRPGLIFGVPVRVLGTVVRSIFFVGLLALASIFIGAAIAFFRIGMRTYAPNSYFCRHEQHPLVRLKLDEN